MIDKVNILGTEYKILCKKDDEEEAFNREGIDGYCNALRKILVVRDLENCKDYQYATQETIEKQKKHILRHEIVHAFCHESGLGQSLNYTGGWADNEEMVDWIAFQGEKIYKAWEEAECL